MQTYRRFKNKISFALSFLGRGNVLEKLLCFKFQLELNQNQLSFLQRFFLQVNVAVVDAVALLAAVCGG